MVDDVTRETGLHRHAVTALFKETGKRIELEAAEALCVCFNCSVGAMF